MGFFAKSDGRVSENEIHQARQIMQEMSLIFSMKREAIRLFTPLTRVTQILTLMCLLID